MTHTQNHAHMHKLSQDILLNKHQQSHKKGEYVCSLGKQVSLRSMHPHANFMQFPQNITAHVSGQYTKKSL